MKQGRPRGNGSVERTRKLELLYAADVPYPDAVEAAKVQPARALKLLFDPGFLERVNGYKVLMLDDPAFEATLLSMRAEALKALEDAA